MREFDIAERDGSEDAIHQRLKKECEKRVTSYLWVEGDTPPFIPSLLTTILGDGRALFTLTTINQRPRYWIIRGCSTWGCGYDRDNSTGPDFAEISDEIMTHLEDCFGRGRCGYSDNSLFWPKKERLRNCQCEECSDRFRARWPMVDDEGGCSWSRMDWPKSFPTVPNPLASYGNLLALPEEGKTATPSVAKGACR